MKASEFSQIDLWRQKASNLEAGLSYLAYIKSRGRFSDDLENLHRILTAGLPDEVPADDLVQVTP